MTRYSFAILAAAICLSGCGSSTLSTSGTTAVRTGITGNWQLAFLPTGAPAGATGAAFGVYFTQTENNVIGILVSQDAYPMCWPTGEPPCNFPFGDLNPEFVGTVDANGNIVLNSVPDTGGGGTFSISASSTDDTTLSGTYSATLVTTSPAGTWTAQGTVSGNTIGTLNGSYSGTLKSQETGNTIGVTTTLSQTSSPDSSGELEVSGSANFTGSTCFASATVPKPGGLLGIQLVIDFVPTNSSTTTIIMSGTLSQDTKTIAVGYIVNNSVGATNACGSDYGSGTLTLQ